MRWIIPGRVGFVACLVERRFAVRVAPGTAALAAFLFDLAISDGEGGQVADTGYSMDREDVHLLRPHDDTVPALVSAVNVLVSIRMTDYRQQRGKT